MSKETIEILTNREAIAIAQDSLGVHALKYNDKIVLKHGLSH